MLFNLYSERTKCPECKAKVRLDYVNLTPSFTCPTCEKEIRVSTLYQKTLRITSWTFALLIAYVLGRDTFWLVLLLWILFTVILTFLWAYVFKYWLPPKLVCCAPDPKHFQGIDLGPK
jgi:uncharacterized paraquat-inducible protein A